jgi:o-succinylbenzoate synthase
MVRINAYTYSRQCTIHGEHYFKDRLRRGILVRVKGNEQLAMGEYAPLLGFHPHGIDEVLSKLSHEGDLNFQEILNEKHDDPFLLSEIFDVLPPPWGYLLSMAHLHQGFRMQSLKEDNDHAIKLSALVEKADVNSAVMTAQGYLAEGFHCLKIKVGSLPISDEVKKIKTIEAIGCKKLILRLDANKRLSFSEAVTLAKAAKQLQYFEEPLADLNLANDFYEETGVPIAVDESLPDLNNKHSFGIKFLIIKPSRLNNIYHLIKLARAAAQNQQTLILSHCFESEFSAAIFALLAENLNLSSHAHGIYAEGFFKQSLYAEPLRSFRGQLSLKACRKFIRQDLDNSPQLAKWSV